MKQDARRQHEQRQECQRRRQLPPARTHVARAKAQAIGVFAAGQVREQHQSEDHHPRAAVAIAQVPDVRHDQGVNQRRLQNGELSNRGSLHTGKGLRRAKAHGGCPVVFELGRPRLKKGHRPRRFPLPAVRMASGELKSRIGPRIAPSGACTRTAQHCFDWLFCCWLPSTPWPNRPTSPCCLPHHARWAF